MIRLAFLVALAGCTEHVQLGDDGRIPGLQSIAIAPPATTLAFDTISAPARHVAYMATGSFLDGSTRDITELLAWSTDNPYPGLFAEPGDYTATGAAAGHVEIRASNADVEGTAALTITVSATVIDSVFPPQDPDLFAASTIDDVPIKEPLIRYPAADTRFPQSLQAILFQHDLGAGNDTVRLHFESDVLDLSVITGGDRWQPDSILWNLIEGSHPGSAVALTLDAASSTAPATFFRAAPITLSFSAAAATDLLYLFSDGPGVVRGSLAATSTSPIIDASSDPHPAISRDGQVMALGAGGKLSTLDLDSLEELLPAMAPMGFATFSPDRSLVLIADKGTLTLRDATTGAPVGPKGGKVDLGPMKKGSHPDWSPDGSFVAITVSDMLDNADAKRGSIGRISYDGTTWGALEILVPSSGDMDNNFAPRWGPDGSIAYVHATSGSKDTKDAELRLLRAGSAPITMSLATQKVGTLDVPDTHVTMPSWTAGADGASWLAFVSTRPYGTIRPLEGTAQIWIAGVDLARPDPSFSAFWLPCQDITAISANPVWAPSPQPTD